MDEKEKAKKQILLRISPTLWRELAQWAEEDFRSINGQIEFLLTECVRKRKGGKKPEEYKVRQPYHRRRPPPRRIIKFSQNFSCFLGPPPQPPHLAEGCKCTKRN